MKLVTPPVISKKKMLKMKSFEREKYIRGIIRKTVYMNPNGVTLKSLEDALPFDYRTIEKHMFALTFTNEVYTQKIGATTLYLSNLVGMKDETKESVKIGGQEFEVSEIKNRNGTFILIRQLEGKDTKGGILIPKNEFNNIVDFLDSQRD